MSLALVVAVALAPDLTFQLEAGSEIDTNVHRSFTGGAPAITGADERLAVRVGGTLSPGRGALRLSTVAAAKVFPASDASSESVAVLAGDARYDIAFGDLAPGVRLSYYDASDLQSGSSFDRAFRTGDAAGALTLRTDDDHRIEASAGYRFFVYKPVPELDFTGAHVGLGLTRHRRSQDGATEISYGASYSLSERSYDGPVLENQCPEGTPLTASCVVPVPSLPRADLFHDASLDFTFTRAFILGARYELQVNDSNSFGQSLVRHRFEVSGTTELFWDLFLNVKVVLILNQFLDAVLLTGDVGTFITIEDESRNALILHATRDIGEAWTLEARYAFYANPFATDQTAYRRHTFYLGVVYSFKP